MEDLVALARAGCEISKLEIINRCRPLILSSIRKYHRYGDYDDLVQEGIVVLLESIYSYDETYGVYFLGYLKLRLRYYYLARRELRDLSLNDRNEYGIEYQELIEDDLDLEELVLDKEEGSFLRESLKKLSRRESLIVGKFYFEGLTLGEIAEELDLSYQTVANLKHRGMKKLKTVVKN